MDSDDRQEPEVCKFIIPVLLVRALSEAMLEILDKWHEAQGEDDFDVNYCQAAMLAATNSSIEVLVFGECASATMQ
jgi:hypothetical protein